VRYGLRQGLNRGLLEGNRPWVVLGGLAVLGHLADRALNRGPDRVFFSRLERGETFEISNDPRSLGS
jgi:hypothetical protein